MERITLIRRVRLTRIAYALNLSRETIYRWVKELSIQVIKGRIYVEDLDILIKNKL